VPYDAARDGVFFRSFSRLHPRLEFPTFGLLAMGVVTAAGFVIGQLTSLTVLIQLLTVVTVLVQAFAQIVALTVLRRRQPELRRPYRMFLYPLPSIVAGLGWLIIYGYADENAPGLHPIELSLLWIAVGGAAFALWARSKGEWPFGPKHVEEQYLHADHRLLDVDEEELTEVGGRPLGGTSSR
jgi:amino acid transporter